MRTLIRASQLHPDISGLVINYASGIYPSYSNISGISGIETYISGSYLLISPQGNERVREINNLTGSLFITGESGIYVRQSGQNIYIGSTGIVGGAGSLANISGYGNVDVWPLNSTTIGISGIAITGIGGVQSYYNPSKTLLTITNAGIGKLNNATGNVSLVGRNGTQVTQSGQNIFIDSRDAAFSGVNSLNGLQGAPVSLIGTADININPDNIAKTITIGYTGIGWGQDQLIVGSNLYTNYIGRQNVIQENRYAFIQGNFNLLSRNTGCALINSEYSSYADNVHSTFVNLTGAFPLQVTGSTLINGNFSDYSFKHPYAFGIGGGVKNTYSANISMKAFLSGKQIMKVMSVPKTSYSGITLNTGTILFGDINYVAVRYDVTNFAASFDAKAFGIYGKKQFMAQRAANLQVDVKDESDLFGGNAKYNLFLSGGNYERLYVWCSGYSGSDPADGLDGVHDVLFMANINFVNFSMDPLN